MAACIPRHRLGHESCVSMMSRVIAKHDWYVSVDNRRPMATLTSPLPITAISCSSLVAVTVSLFKTCWYFTALPDQGPTITGSRLRYQIGDRVHVTCTSGKSRPATRLAWYINGEQAPAAAVLNPTQEVSDDGLETTSLALDFKVKPKHFRKGDLKLKVRH